MFLRMIAICLLTLISAVPVLAQVDCQPDPSLLVTTAEHDSAPPHDGKAVTRGAGFTVQYLEFASQLSADPGVYDADNVASCSPTNNTPLTLGIRYVTPDAGVTADTGLIIDLGGIGTGDCPPYINLFTFDTPGSDPLRESWVNDRNVVLAKVFYRNWNYWPYDYGKYQVVDVLRGVGAMLQQYPQIDTTRIYLIGGSGGAHVALQVMQAYPTLFAEVYALAGITRITTNLDVAAGQPYQGDTGGNSNGWNTNMLPYYPVTQGSMPAAQFERITAERKLKGPQIGLARRAPIGELAPMVYVAHGDNDPTVHYQHMVDLSAAIVTYSGVAPMHDTATTWSVDNWKFMRIPGGNHAFTGGPSDRDTRSEAINVLNPNCFTRENPVTPTQSVNVYLPAEDGDWTYHFSGSDLSNVTVTTVQYTGNAGIDNWQDY